jgi:hypothetical protein
MLIDLVFFGLPIILAICLAAHAIREGDSRFWLAAFSWIAYCTFYLAGGRGIILYLGSLSLGAGSWLLW